MMMVEQVDRLSRFNDAYAPRAHRAQPAVMSTSRGARRYPFSLSQTPQRPRSVPTDDFLNQLRALCLTGRSAPKGRGMANAKEDQTSPATWVEQATPGARTVYHTGDLGRDRYQPDVGRQACAWMRLADQRLVFLLQKRLGPNRFAYIAERHRQASIGSRSPEGDHRQRATDRRPTDQHPLAANIAFEPQLIGFC